MKAKKVLGEKTVNSWGAKERSENKRESQKRPYPGRKKGELKGG